MKINVDRTTAGFAAEKNDKQSKTPQTSTPASKQLPETKDELELTSKKAAVLNSVRETNTESASSVNFDISQVPMMKQRLQLISNYIISNPLEAISSQANLNPETVARLIS